MLTNGMPPGFARNLLSSYLLLYIAALHQVYWYINEDATN